MRGTDLSSANLTAHNDAVMRAVLYALENNLGLGSAVTGVGFSETVLVRLRAIRAQLHPDAEWLRLGGALRVCPCVPCWLKRTALIRERRSAALQRWPAFGVSAPLAGWGVGPR